MAILRSGILGNIRGKIAGTVGTQWKDKNVLREYVKPANPQSAAQVIQRTKMADCVVMAKQLVGQVFNPYTDRFQKSMSGFNRFIKSNIDVFDESVDLEDIKVTEGKLSPISDLVATYNAGTGEVLMTWAENLGANGDSGDAAFYLAYTTENDIAYFAAEEVQRDTEAGTLTLPTGFTPGFVCVYVFTIRYVANIVNLISNSVSDYCAVP